LQVILHLRDEEFGSMNIIRVVDLKKEAIDGCSSSNGGPFRCKLL